ncbi:NUDIX domain-containing protein [Halomicrobium salinisoli]|uniref:NUDIX domain-containing protein n=1 Tax=Halomicrobium salinisoli TaxID=2878391 RepID=UPI001CF00719|nr:NUDIX hydrolase [Halomicrobium salinisoli]
MESLSDPEALRERDDVDVRDRTVDASREEFGRLRDHWTGLDGYVAVGVPNRDGAVPLMNVGDGWTLPAGPVETGGDYAAAARRVVENTLGVAPGVERPERAYHSTFRGDGDRFVAHTVVFRAAPVAGEPVAAEPHTVDEGAVEVDWFEEPPERIPEGPDEDVRLFLG